MEDIIDSIKVLISFNADCLSGLAVFSTVFIVLLTVLFCHILTHEKFTKI